MKKKIRNPYYELVLEDAACPSFCSFTKSFHGNLSDIKGLMEALAGDNERGYHNRILNAFQAWEQGNLDVTHSPAYHECKLLTPEEVIDYEDFTFQNVIWQHTNIWGFIYELKADTIDVSQIVVKKDSHYIRCIRPVFENLAMRSSESPIPQMLEWRPVGDMFWGYPHMMVLQGRYTYPRLFINQKYYTDIQEAIHDLRDETKIDYSVVCEEIFGDG